MGQLLCDLGVASRVVRGDKILLVQEAHGTHQGRWGLPKGHVEANESPETAALRELKEETGLDGTLVGLVGVRTALRSQGPAVFLCYDVHAENAEASGGDDEIASTAWCSLGELKHLEWVSETMHQLAVDGLTHRSALVNQAGLTQRTTAYAVYRTGQAKSLDGGWLR